MKAQKGMFENIDTDLYDFIQQNSNTLCPEGKYDNTVICSQTALIRFVGPILFQNKERISLERAKKYAKHQHYLGTQKKDLVEFAESQKKELIEKLEIIHKQMQNKQYKTSRISLGILLHCLETPLEKYKQL